MSHLKFDFAVIGGDMRQVYLAEYLLECGCRVCKYALCVDIPDSSCYAASSLSEAVSNAETVLAPIPINKSKEIPLSLLPDMLREGQSFFAGCIPRDFQEKVFSKGIFVSDLMKDEILTVKNSIATAEGAIAEAIQKSSRNLHGSRCLVLGYGTCGKTLVSYLTGMFCHVTVCARRPGIRAEAETLTGKAIAPEALKEHADSFDFIFNTIPAPILDRSLLKSLRKQALIIDIASAPGGVDFAAARDLGISAYLCPGLPGRYAPRSSAHAIAEAVFRILKEFNDMSS